MNVIFVFNLRHFSGSVAAICLIFISAFILMLGGLYYCKIR